MLVLTEFIGKGATRLCFRHPKKEAKCVKVAVRPKEEWLLKREIDVYFSVKTFFKEYLIPLEKDLVQTNYGPGLVCDFFKDSDGGISKTLDFYIGEKCLSK